MWNLPHELFLTWTKASPEVGDQDERLLYGNMWQNYRLERIAVVACWQVQRSNRQLDRDRKKEAEGANYAAKKSSKHV